MRAIALPLTQLERLTISWITALRSGVRWSVPAWPVVHAFGTHATGAVVRGRVETLFEVVVKVGALSSACPLIVRLVAPLSVARAVNWMYAAEMAVPFAIGMPGQRMPTTCWLLPSTTRFSEPLVRLTEPFCRCSASSEDTEIIWSLEILPSSAMLADAGEETRPAASVAVTVTVYVPEAA